MFLEQWSKFFDSETRSSEWYGIWATIGTNMEKTILEELQRMESRTTDIMSFSEDMFRSWLAFFFAKIPCCISATCSATISYEGSSRVTFNSGDVLMSNSGYPYIIQNTLELGSGTTSGTVFCIQGRKNTAQGTYSNLIRVQVQNPDMSYLKLTVDGKEIPELSFQNSFNTLTYVGVWNAETNTPSLYSEEPEFKKGWFYMVTEGGSQPIGPGDTSIEVDPGEFIVHNGQGWQKANDFTGLNFIQWNESYAIPINGYFAYYYGGYLYIKVYPGVDVDNPEGKTWVLEYISSDGSKAQVEERTTEDPENFTTDKSGTFVITNTASTPGIDQPDSYKLGLYLKQRIYSSTSLSTVSQYTDWFRAQPEIGDCIVVSDFEMRQAHVETDVTGKVLVYALKADGNPLPAMAPEGSTPNITNQIYDRIQPFKDIAILEFVEAVPIYHFFAVEYRTANEGFEAYFNSLITSYYDINKVSLYGTSLFNEVDISKIVEMIMKDNTYNVIGLKITGYLYGEDDEERGASSMYSLGGLPYPDVSVGDGFYLITGTGDNKDTVSDRYDEFENTTTLLKSATVYKVDPRTLIPLNNSNYGTITEYTDRVEMDLRIAIPANKKLRGFMKPKDYGLLPVEAFHNRKLAGYSMKSGIDTVPRYNFND